jgi:hypothetical protein
MRLLAAALLSLCITAIHAAAQTTTYAAETSNNTAACSAAASPSYCKGGFTPMSDSASGVYNPAPGNVSAEDIHSLFYSGNTTRIFAYFQPWFCMQSGSTVTGTGTLCNKHVQVGYNSNDSATVNGQINDMLRRGFDGIAVDWYATDQSVAPNYDATTKLIRDNLAARCSGPQSCPMYFALMEDEGSFKWTSCPRNDGTDQTQCLINSINANLDYANSTYFQSNAYLRVNKKTMQIDPTGRPVVLYFICEECWSNPTPNWSLVWAQVRAHTNTYGSTTPQLYFIFRNSNGFAHTETDGAFAWVNWYGSNDPYGFVYLDNYYDTATSATHNNPNLITFGASWKGFDENNAPWITTAGRTIAQQCGNTWVQTFKQATHNNDFSASYQLPFSGVVTWNDYEEGTEIETGIDNCLRLSASVSGTVLSWQLSFSNASGSESTVHHYLVFDSTNGQNLKQVASLLPGTRSIDLKTLSLLSGSSHTLYVKAVGQPSIQNKMSNAVSYTVTTPLTLSLGLSPASVTGGTSSKGTVTLSNPAPSGGAVVALKSSSVVAVVPSSVTIAAGATSASFTIKTSAVSASTSATITSTYSGLSSSATLSVKAPAMKSLTLSPTSVQGGVANSTGTVTLTGPAPSGGRVVTLTSNNTAVAKVPSSVTVAAGYSTAKFTITTYRVSSTKYVTISAANGGVTKSATLTVTH